MDEKKLKEELPEDFDPLEQEDEDDDSADDILDELTPEQLARLQESITQAEEGKTIPHEMVMAFMKALVMRRSRQNL